MTLSHNTTIVTDGKALLPGMHQGKANFEALLGIFLAKLQEVEDTFWDSYVLRQLDNATAAQLNLIGKIVGEPRRLISSGDADYRRLIRARIAANKSAGTIAQVLRVLRGVLPDVDKIILQQLFAAGLRATVDSDAVTDEESTIAALFLRDAALGGVTTRFVSNTFAPSNQFRFLSQVTNLDGAISAGATSFQGREVADIAAWSQVSTSMTLVLNPGGFTQEIITADVYYDTGAGQLDVSSVVNELSGSGLRFDHEDREIIAVYPSTGLGLAGVRSNITWTNLTDADADGNDLTKDTTTGWGANARGGFSSEDLAGDGAAEYTKLADSDVVAVGLSEADTDEDYTSIDYCLLANGATDTRIVESGSIVSTGHAAMTAGDVGRVQRIGTEITYWLNNDLLYTSGVTDAGNKLYVDSAIYGNGDGIVNAVIYSWLDAVGGKLASMKSGEE